MRNIKMDKWWDENGCKLKEKQLKTLDEAPNQQRWKKFGQHGSATCNSYKCKQQKMQEVLQLKSRHKKLLKCEGCWRNWSCMHIHRHVYVRLHANKDIFSSMQRIVYTRSNYIHMQFLHMFQERCIFIPVKLFISWVSIKSSR